ncbi:MAG TPA: ABC transporter ATP-binding protein [Actinomycetota bacterium]
MPLLQAEDVQVRFGGLIALDGARLVVEEGAITGLIGPNGAGKTTMFNVICGLQEHTRGNVFLDEREISKLKPHQRARRGIARTFQRLEIFGSLTVFENVLMGAETKRRYSKEKFDPRAVAKSLLHTLGLQGVADVRADAMPTGMARLVELGRALATKPRILLLDEPSSGLGDEESDAFADLLLKLTAEGLGILLVEHDVGLVMRVCSRIFVLDFGRPIAEGTPEEIQAHPAVQAAYLGTPEAAEELPDAEAEEEGVPA